MTKTLSVAFIFLLPMVAFAQALQPIKTFISSVSSIATMIIPLLIIAAMIFFFFGLVKYVRGGKKFAAAGKNIMIAGIVSLFVMVSIWGIIKMAQNALGIERSAGAPLPAIPGTRMIEVSDY